MECVIVEQTVGCCSDLTHPHFVSSAVTGASEGIGRGYALEVTQ